MFTAFSFQSSWSMRLISPCISRSASPFKRTKKEAIKQEIEWIEWAHKKHLSKRWTKPLTASAIQPSKNYPYMSIDLFVNPSIAMNHSHTLSLQPSPNNQCTYGAFWISNPTLLQVEAEMKVNLSKPRPEEAWIVLFQRIETRFYSSKSRPCAQDFIKWVMRNDFEALMFEVVSHRNRWRRGAQRKNRAESNLVLEFFKQVARVCFHYFRSLIFCKCFGSKDDLFAHAAWVLRSKVSLSSTPLQRWRTGGFSVV